MAANVIDSDFPERLLLRSNAMEHGPVGDHEA
jgi:hypothetical protein